jgi:3-dehydroquinate synthase
MEGKMQTVNVPLGDRAYDIVIAPGCLTPPLSSPQAWEGMVSRLAAVLVPGEAAALVSDSHVWPLYGEAAMALLEKAGARPVAVVLPPGEASKSLDTLALLYERLFASHVTRQGAVVALGGGVIGDCAGFAASTWMRGITYIQLPTSLLAQVDSSVGGKTAVNTAGGKNLAGTFWQPHLVLIDPETLLSLPPREYACGMAEVIKYGAACSRELFEKIEQGRDGSALPEIIHDCCAIKAGIVAADEHDVSGLRAVLNFGHTFGHAIEAKYQFSRYNHGEAVACGMRIAADLGERLGLTEAGTAARLKALLDNAGLEADEPRPGLMEYIKSDKKSDADSVNLILLKRIGESFVYNIPFDELERLL